jgi:hypothetical protein
MAFFSVFSVAENSPSASACASASASSFALSAHRLPCLEDITLSNNYIGDAGCCALTRLDLLALPWKRIALTSNQISRSVRDHVGAFLERVQNVKTPYRDAKGQIIEYQHFGSARRFSWDLDDQPCDREDEIRF